MKNKIVKVIYPNKNINDNNKNKKVCAYARVSTLLNDQQNSYKTQINYYTKFIKNNINWEFVGVYCDEGISGTRIKNRLGFKKMINDGINGKFNLIITKSISRFARNTVEALQTIRLLKNHGVEVFFEKENIKTFDPKIEIILSILSSLAEEESRSISENTKWGIRRRFERGFAKININKLYGYEKNDAGQMVINNENAKIVQNIFIWFLSGMSFSKIAKKLTDNKIKTPTGKNLWRGTVIKSILTNEKYIGDCMCQKYITIDCIQKIRKKNDNIEKKFYIENNHEPIIDRHIFDAVQDKIKNVLNHK